MDVLCGRRQLTRVLQFATVAAACTLATAAPAHGGDTLCDPSNTNCRSRLIALIQNERVGIDVAYWFMTDARYSNEIVKRWQAGVPVRILVDPRANPENPGNDTIIAQFSQARIPMRKRIASGILHWKLMLFAGQQTVEFGSANFSPAAFVPITPYSNYVAESVFYTDDPSTVDSFKTKFDDAWVDTSSYANYANVSGPLSRTYPTYAIDPDMNFVPSQNVATRAVSAYNAESQRIDAIVFRVTDRRHSDAMIAARGRGVAVRLIIDRPEYRNPKYLWDAWNVDRMYMAGIPIRWQGHQGDNHEKVVLLYGQRRTIFGSSNWTSASASSQAEHNLFTTSAAIFTWFSDQFSRMWGNLTGVAETAAFKPLPPDIPRSPSPANGGSTTASPATLKWYGGPWAHSYDIYFGTSPDPPLYKSNLSLGPSTSTTVKQTYPSPALTAGRVYYWRVVSRTFANKTTAGPVWSFTR
jgi:phosphatidylserine/phosphatidylglycerophosphate/cardiolipin synthase-like enzyme